MPRSSEIADAAATIFVQKTHFMPHSRRYSASAKSDLLAARRLASPSSTPGLTASPMLIFTRGRHDERVVSSIASRRLISSARSKLSRDVWACLNTTAPRSFIIDYHFPQRHLLMRDSHFRHAASRLRHRGAFSMTSSQHLPAHYYYSILLAAVSAFSPTQPLPHVLISSPATPCTRLEACDDFAAKKPAHYAKLQGLIVGSALYERTTEDAAFIVQQALMRAHGLLAAPLAAPLAQVDVSFPPPLPSLPLPSPSSGEAFIIRIAAFIRQPRACYHMLLISCRFHADFTRLQR